MICDSPSHLYHSALPLSPSSSWVRRCYEAEVAEEVRVLTGLPDRWEGCSRTIILLDEPSAFAHHGDIIAVGLGLNVELLDEITGDRTSVFYGHTRTISSITFSPDGTLLVSGSKDKSARLWDIQTGGLVRTFHAGNCLISATSISPDGTVVALGTTDGSIRLWDVRTGDCRHIATLRWNPPVKVISFSPVDSQRLSSLSGRGDVGHWGVDGHPIELSHRRKSKVEDLAYAPDGNRFVWCGGSHAAVQDSKSGEELHRFDGKSLSRCCFSPDGRFVVCGGETTIYVWDITTGTARLVETLVGHSKPITFLAFSSSLISGSLDRSVKFWRPSSFLAESTTIDRAATLRPYGSTPIQSFNFFAEESTIVTSDSLGAVKTWDLKTGTCKSFSTKASGPRDTHLQGDTLIIVWHDIVRREYDVWDVYKGRLSRTVGSFILNIERLKISGDGSQIFGLYNGEIEAVSMQTSNKRSVLCETRAFNFFAHGSKVGISHSRSKGWDFGGPGSPSFGEFPDGPRLDLVDRFRGDTLVEPHWIKDTVTKRLVLRIPEKYTKSGAKVEWDGRHLLVWYESGELVVMDFDPVQRALDRIH